MSGFNIGISSKDVFAMNERHMDSKIFGSRLNKSGIST